MNTFEIIGRTCARTIQLKCAPLGNRVWTLEDPVLPCGQATKNLSFHRFRTSEAQVSFQTCQRIRRVTRTLLNNVGHFIRPIDVVQCFCHETQLITGGSIELLTDSCLRFLNRLWFTQETSI